MTQPRLVKQINPGIRESRNDGGWSQGLFSAIGDMLFFLVSDGLDNPVELWRSDGTAQETIRLAGDIKGFRGFHIFEDSVFFNTDAGLWISDGTATGARLLTPTPEDANIFIDSIVRLGGAVIAYVRGWPYYGFWEIDKTKGLISQRISSRNAEFGVIASIGNSLYFSSRDNFFGPNVNIELWRSDGTESGTFQAADIWPGDRSEESSDPRGFTVLGGNLLFTANDGTHGFELWRSDGTAAGTAMVADINPGNVGSVHFWPYGQQPVIQGSIYFAATDGESGYELWKSDGTSAGTKRVADINPGSNGSSPRELTVVGETLYFTAFSQGGYGLWKSDGTEEGTQLVSGIDKPQFNIYRSEPRYLTAVGDSVFFTAIGNLNTGRELWKSDGTAAGTKMVADIFPGSTGSEPRDLKLVGNTLYFSAKSDLTSGRQLWALDVSSELADDQGQTPFNLQHYESISSISLASEESQWFQFSLPDEWKEDDVFSINSYDLYFKTTRPKSVNINLYDFNRTPIAWESVAAGSSVFVELQNKTNKDFSIDLDAHLWKINGQVFNGSTSHDVSIRKYDKDASPVSFEDTWLISHGWNDSTLNLDENYKFNRLANEINNQNGEVVLVDWSKAANSGPKPRTDPQKAAFWIRDVASFVSHALASTWAYGVASQTVQRSINLAGHSLGAYLSSEIARALGSSNTSMKYNIDRLIALDPADYINRRYNINNNMNSNGKVPRAVAKAFNEVAGYSLALFGEALKTNGSGDETTAREATHSFEVFFDEYPINYSTEDPSLIERALERAAKNHGNIVSLYANLIAAEPSQLYPFHDYFDLRMLESNAQFSTVSDDEGKIFGVQDLGELNLSTRIDFAASRTTGESFSVFSGVSTLAISATDADKPEGFSGNTPFTFTVTRSGDASAVSSARWAVTAIGTTPADAADFARGVLPSGTVRFQAGETSRTISVHVRPDPEKEADERFRVTLSAPTGATITTATALGIIRNDDLIGTSAADTIVGTSRPEFIDGLAGQDTLTGGAGPDVFGFRFGQSRIGTPDRITDFRFGEDKISLLNGQGQLLAAPLAFSRAADNSTATSRAALADAVFADANGRAFGNQPLAANAAALVRSTNAAIAGTYLLINDGSAGRSLSSDLMVEISGFSGRLPALGVRPVESVFG